MTPVDTVILYQYVEMIDIDEIVMRECAKHMRDTAGDSLDNYVGDNYRIYAEDCIPRLEKYKNEGMSAYSKIQEQEFAREKDGYTSVKHQREVGTSYFDAVSNTISGGKSSTTAMDGSTESEQF